MDRQTGGAEGARDPRAAGSTSDSGASRVNAPWYEKRDAISVALNERFLGVPEEFMDYATEEYGEPSASVENLRDFGRGAAAASTSRSSRPTMRELREERPERHSPGDTTRDALLASSWQRLSKYYAASNAVPLDVQSILQRENPYNWGKKFTKEQIKEGASELVVVSPQKVLGQALVYERWGNEAYEVHLKVKYGVLSARKFTLLAHYLEITLKMPEYASAAYDEALRLVQDSIILLRGFIGCVRYQRYLILCLRFSSWLHHAIFRSTAMETKRCNLKAIVDRFMERTQFLENLNETDRPREIEVPSEELIAVADVQVQNRLLTIAVDYWNEAEDFLKSTEHHRLFVGATESAMDKNVDMTSPTGYFLRFVRESLARIEKYDNAVLRPRSW